MLRTIGLDVPRRAVIRDRYLMYEKLYFLSKKRMRRLLGTSNRISGTKGMVTEMKTFMASIFKSFGKPCTMAAPIFVRPMRDRKFKKSMGVRR